MKSWCCLIEYITLDDDKCRTMGTIEASTRSGALEKLLNSLECEPDVITITLLYLEED
jgi:hypothetical protein